MSSILVIRSDCDYGTMSLLPASLASLPHTAPQALTNRILQATYKMASCAVADCVILLMSLHVIQKKIDPSPCICGQSGDRRDPSIMADINA